MTRIFPPFNAAQQAGSRDARGFWFNSTFDSVGQTVGTTDPLNNTTMSTFDLDGELTAARDAMGFWSRFYSRTSGPGGHSAVFHLLPFFGRE